jgi:hypothetical protein
VTFAFGGQRWGILSELTKIPLELPGSGRSRARKAPQSL